MSGFHRCIVGALLIFHTVSSASDPAGPVVSFEGDAFVTLVKPGVQAALVDLRKDPPKASDQIIQDPPEYTVAFMARSPNPFSEKNDNKVGHIWVSWAEGDKTLGRPVVKRAHGFWPEEKFSYLSFMWVPGKLRDEPKKARDLTTGVTHAIVFLVDKGLYEETLKETSKFKIEKPFYQIAEYSCKTFAVAVFKRLGVDGLEPATFDYPHTMLINAFEIIDKDDRFRGKVQGQLEKFKLESNPEK